jgi:uncharacterized coiled-coil protein SlyX
LTTAGGDPTPRTIEQLNQAIAGQRELFDAKLENIETKFESNDKAILLLQQIANSQPTPGILEERLIALKESMAKQFQGVKELRDALAISDKESINLALQATKEAAAKTEDAFNKQMDALAERVNDTKERLTIIEAGGQGSRQSYAGMMAAASLIIAAIVAATVVLSKLG